MSLPTPKGSFAVPIVQLRTMVSLSKEFQKQTKTDTATDALSRVHLTRKAEIIRPFACIMVGDSHNYRQDSGGDANFLISDGNIGIYMTIDTNPLYKFDLDSAVIEASSFFGTVMDEVVELSAKDNPRGDISHLPLTNVRLTMFDDSGDEESESVGEFFYAVYMVTWGIGG